MTLKPWMKILLWFGMGSGIGFFAGYQVGYTARKKSEEPAHQGWEDILPDEDGKEEAAEALNEYTGYDGDTDSDVTVDIDLSDAEALHKQLDVNIVDPVPLVSHEPYPITEDEFNYNENGYEIKCLDYYEGDEVLYNPEDDDIVLDVDRILGENALLGFGGDPNNPVEVLYIQNDDRGAIYRVELVHESFNDTTEYATAPQEDPGDELEDHDEQDDDNEDDDDEETW